MRRVIKVYYRIRPFVPQCVRMSLRRFLVRGLRAVSGDRWPIDPQAAVRQPPWKNWPDGNCFALVRTHDVELASDLDNIRPLMEMEQQFGFRSSLFID